MARKTQVSEMPAVRRKPGRKWEHHLDVIGLGFRMKKGSREALHEMIEKHGDIRGVRLEREPDNEYDPNAIAVYLPERVMGGCQLGYLRRQSAELLAPKIDSGYLTVVSVQLQFLYEDDGLKSGQLHVVFQDHPKR